MAHVFSVPPRIATGLVELFIADERSETMLGDLHEEFAELASKSGVASARRWYWQQSMKSIGHLVIEGFRDAPLSTAAAVVGGFLLLRLVSPLPEKAIFAVLQRYQIFEHHFRAYGFFASNGIALAHVIVSMLVGCVVALTARGREMVTTITLALILATLICASWVVVGPKYWSTDGAFAWMLWQCADLLSIAAGGIILRKLRPTAGFRASRT